MDLQSYYRNLYASFRDEEEKKKRKIYDPSSFDDSLQKYADDNPERDSAIAAARGFAPGYENAPAQTWVPTDIAGTFQKIIETSPQEIDPIELETRLNAAYYMTKTKNVTFEDAFSNLDSYLEADYGKATGPKTGLDALVNVVNTGIINRQIYKYANELKGRVGAFDGQYKDWAEIEKDPLYTKIRELETRIPTQDVMKRAWPIETLKKVMQVIPSYVESLGKGALAGTLASIGTTALMGGQIGTVGGPVGTVVGLAAGATAGAIVSIIPTIASLATGLAMSTEVALNTQEAEGGAAFYDMLKFRDPVTGERIDPVQAARWARIYEGFAAAVEMMQTDVFFKPFTNTLNTAQKNAFRGAVKSSLGSIADASARAGNLIQLANTTAGKYFLELGKETLQETFEEDLQEGLQIWTTEQAKRITNKLDGTSITPIQKEEIQKRIVDTTVSTAIGMGILHAFPAAKSVRNQTLQNMSEGISEGIKEFAAEKLRPEAATSQEGKRESTITQHGAEESVAPLVIFKSYESAPGVMEFRGTTDAEGEKRSQSVSASVIVDDENKTATISNIGVRKAVAKDPTESLRQFKEAIKNIRAELPNYEIIFNPRSAIGKQAQSEIETETPDIFKKPADTKQQDVIQGNAQDGPRKALESNEGKIDGEAPESSAALQQEAIQPTQEEAKFSPEDLARSQREGASRVESVLDSGGYKFTTDTEAEVAKIQFHPNLPNFKEGVNAQGVGRELVGPPDTLGMAPIILYETKDGQRYIVTGRHRLDLWKRYKYPTIPAQILKESDGYTISDMAIVDAENNIRDNQGTEKDYAKYFERIGIGEKEAERRGLLRGDKGKLGFYIGTFATPEVRSLYYSGKISAAKAAAIAQVAPNDSALQTIGLRVAQDKRLSADEIRESMYSIKLNAMRRKASGEQKEMFGDDIEIAGQVEIGKAAAAIKNEIDQELSVLKQAVRMSGSERMKYVERFGFKIDDVGGVQKRLDELYELATKWSGEMWSTDPELYYQARLRAGQVSEEEQAQHDQVDVQPEEQDEILFENSTAYGTPNYDKLREIANESKNARDFALKLTQSNLVDLSNPDLHRFGRAIPYSQTERYTDIEEIQNDKSPNGYMEVMKYSNKKEYSLINNGKNTVTIYRAVPITDKSTLIARYEKEKAYILKTGKLPSTATTSMSENEYYNYISGEIEKIKNQEYAPSSETIRAGDYVALDRDYAKTHGESVLKGEQGVPYKIISKTVPKKDVVWGEADFTEWAYSPRELRDTVPDLSTLYDKLKNNDHIKETLLREDAPVYGNNDPITSPSPWIYKSEDIINAKMKGPMPGSQVLRMLQASGVKGEELKWTGLDEFLATNDKKSPKEVQDFIQANKLYIEEREYGDNIEHRPGKFSRYTLPRGEYYREILFTLPETVNTFETWWRSEHPNGEEIPTGEARAYAEKFWKSETQNRNGRINYRSSHWVEPNVLAHTRINDRTTADGKRILFIEEIQSDWHQEGRKTGYARSDYGLQINGNVVATYKTEIEAYKAWQERRMEGATILPPGVGIPDAPFKKTWHEFVFKRILRMATDGGYDAIAWTTGEQQAERYDLSKQVDSILYKSNGDGTYRVSAQIQGRGQMLGDALTESQLEDNVGKEIAKKIVDGAGDRTNIGGNSYSQPVDYWNSLKGVDLKVGGEGMKGFYDKILVDFANKYGKKWNTGVVDETIGRGPKYSVKNEIVKGEPRYVLYQDSQPILAYREEQEALDAAVRREREGGGDGQVVHKLPITDLMRGAVQEGQYLFERAGSKYGFSLEKAQYRLQKLKAREIMQLVASNADGLFNDDIRGFVAKTNAALVKALEDAKDSENTFISSARNDVKATITPALDDSKAWDLNLYISGERVSSARYKNRVDAIEALYLETAPVFGGAASWSVAGAEPELFDTTDLQFGDMAKMESEQTELFEYENDSILRAYGSLDAFEKANDALQLNLFDGVDSGNGDLFSGSGDEGIEELGRTGANGNTRRRKPIISPLLGEAGKASSTAFKENRKRQRRVDFVGQTVTTPRDVAELFSVYRNPQVETFHLIYVDKYGKVLAHNAMSSGVAGRTVGLERKGNPIASSYLVLRRMGKLGAEKVYLLHNHPSGDPEPSRDDIGITRYYSYYLGDKFASHVIIDHNKAAYISTRDVFGGFNDALSNDDIAKQIRSNDIASGYLKYNIDLDSLPRVMRPEDAEKYAIDTLQAGDRDMALIITDYHHRIIEWRPWKNSDIQSIYQAVKESGGSRAVIATSNKNKYEKIVADSKKSEGRFNVIMSAIYAKDRVIEHEILHEQASGLPTHYDYIVRRSGSDRASNRYVMERELADEASSFETYSDFRSAYLAEGEGDEELRAAWAESRKNKTPEELDQDFVSMLRNDRQKLRDFLEANGADLFNRKTPRKNMSVVDATSYRLATGGQVSDATIDRAFMLIEKYSTKWRKRFSDLTGELWAEGKPKDFEITRAGRKDLATLQSQHKEAISKLPSDAAPGVRATAEELAARTDELKSDLENKKRQLEEYQKRFSYGEKRIVDMVRQLKDVERRVWAARSMSKLSPDQKELAKELETQANELRAAISERTAALSPQSGMKGAAYVSMQKAVKEATYELKKQYAIEKAARTERQLKLYYAKMISRPVAKSVDYKVGIQIRELQKKLDPFFRKDPSATAAGKPLNSWSVEELEQFYEEVETLREYGRNLYSERLFERSAERDSARVELSEKARESGKARPSYYQDTDEQRAQHKEDRKILKIGDISLTTIHRIARKLDGEREGGPFYSMIVEQEREAFRNEKDNFDRRFARIEAKMQELGLNRDVMYHDKVKLGEQTISKWEAIGLFIGMQNKRTMDAIIYGNMFSQEERETLSDEELYSRALLNVEYVNRAIANLTPEEVELAETFIEDGDTEFDRLAEATYIYENRVPERERVYFPHERKSRAGESDTPEEVIDQVLARAGKAQRAVGKQPTINRIDIAPRNQSPISIDAYQVYRRGMERQEHYIAYAKYISDMNSILKNGKTAGRLRESVRLYHGQQYLDYLDRWISEAANPKAFTDFNKPVEGIDRFFKMMRGPLGVAYLGYRASRGVFQLITSPAPYLPYAGTFMVARMVKNLNPAEFMRVLSFAKESSAFIRHRTINPTDAYIKNYLETNQSALKRNAMSAAGAIMEWSDMWSVSTGWMAVYEKTTTDLKDTGKSAEEIHRAAVREADKVTIETQPTYRHQDLSPAFKGEKEIERFLFQFQTPLNVIYNQLFHDTKADWKSGHRGRALGIISGYLSVMGLMAIITAPKDDDEDESKKLKYFLSGMASAPLDTIPFIGSLASGYVDSLITGDRNFRENQIFPGVNKIFDGASRLATAEDEERAFAAFMRLLEGAGMIAGVPTSAVKEYYRVIFKGEWGALWGQRPGD